MEFSNQLRGVEIFVSPPGAGIEGGTGSFADPYHSIATAISAAAGGGTVLLRGGEYVESVHVTGVGGTSSEKIVVRPYESELVVIDALIPDFLHPTEDAHWDPVGGEEYVWSQPFPAGFEVAGGAFMDRAAHTRLVRYDRLEDLRSTNERWPKDAPTGDNRVWTRERDENGDIVFKISYPAEYRMWVYMGPGFWFDVDIDGVRRLRLRLSQTHNNLSGWPDYAESTDPTEVRLAFSERDSHALFLRDCQHLTFENLTMRFGGEDTVRIRNCSDIVFDHVNLRAASRAIMLRNEGSIETEKNVEIVFRHCEIDGGLPPWFFRSDRKDTYFFGPNDPDAPSEAIALNRLGASTSGVLISGGVRTSQVTVHHCDIFNGHDVYVFGVGMRFHHNFVHNLNDDGLAVSGAAGVGDARIYRNVIIQCLTVPSMGADGLLGHTYLYRNLIDLRERVAALRPATDGDPHALRRGHFYKGDRVEEGPFDLFHNTCVVLDPGGDDADGEVTRGFKHYSGQLEAGGPRRAHNNIFVAAYTGEPRELAFLPPSTFDGPTDGNIYFRIPADPDPIHELFLVRTPGSGDHFTLFETLDAYRHHFWPDNPEDAYEKNGIVDDPQFRTFDPSGAPHGTDDLRLQPDSPAQQKGADLPNDLEDLDLEVRGPLHLGSHNRGCYLSDDDRLRVGVDSQHVFP